MPAGFAHQVSIAIGRMRMSGWLALCATVVIAGTSLSGAQPPVLDDVLSRTGAYVREYIPRFANVVLLEAYEQRVKTPAHISTLSSPVPVSWRLESDLLLVSHPLSELDWVLFRDVATADGQPVGGRDDRLMQLFVQPTADSFQRALAIAQESTRYHVPGGSAHATNPLIVIALMQPQYHSSLRLRLGGEERSLGQGVRAIAFQELESRESTNESGARRREPLPAILGNEGERVRGNVWVEVSTGRILKTEARIGHERTVSTSVTTFVHNDRLEMMVPREMRTTWQYENRPVEGMATYSNFRRFQVTTSQGEVGPFGQ